MLAFSCAKERNTLPCSIVSHHGVVQGFPILAIAISPSGALTGAMSEKNSGKLFDCHAYSNHTAVSSAVVMIRRSVLME
jgi:hypothetical protein